MTWGIFKPDGELDTDPEPMVFATRAEAVEFLMGDPYEGTERYYVAEIIPGDHPRKETFNTTVSSYGTSLTIAITKQAKRMGLQRGDIVRVTLETITEDD